VLERKKGKDMGKIFTIKENEELEKVFHN